MCCEDVRLGRKLAPQETVTVTPLLATPQLLFKGNFNRGRVVLTANGPSSINGWSNYTIRAGGKAGIAIASIYSTQPSLVLRVEDYGQLLTDELWVSTLVDGTYTLEAVSLVWLEEVCQE